jgi:CheY-like chemotaxis protein
MALNAEEHPMAFKILVVDDDPAVLKTLKNMIQSLGYEVLALTDSREAAQRIKRQKIDAVFVDARMPFVDGKALAQEIRNSPTNYSVPIVMLTGYDDIETMREGFRAGITYFLAKPPDLSQVSNLLKLMQGIMLREKRSYARLPLRTVVGCRKDNLQFTSASVNIGEGGMLLESSGGLEVGQETELRFSLPSFAGSLNPKAKVVRREAPDRMAVQFLELSSEERKAIQTYIAGLIKG